MQYGAKPFEQQHFRTPGVERVKDLRRSGKVWCLNDQQSIKRSMCIQTVTRRLSVDRVPPPRPTTCGYIFSSTFARWCVRIAYGPYAIQRKHNGCHSAILSFINPKIEPVPIIVVHDRIRFHENRFRTFRIVLFTDKLTEVKHCLFFSGRNERCLRSACCRMWLAANRCLRAAVKLASLLPGAMARQVICRCQLAIRRRKPSDGTLLLLLLRAASRETSLTELSD